MNGQALCRKVTTHLPITLYEVDGECHPPQCSWPLLSGFEMEDAEQKIPATLNADENTPHKTNFVVSPAA